MKFLLTRRSLALRLLMLLSSIVGRCVLAADGPIARSDSDAKYLHHIDLYDVDNRKITAESTRPYSPRNTCGRCHDYETISHGWHFNAFDSTAYSGRDGEPWIWTDARTATQLPLTYRDWTHSFHPDQAGLSAWAMTQKFGARIPGGGLGEPEGEAAETGRWNLTGAMEIDCLACHAVDGVYDMNARREQIEKQNFSFAPTAALRLGQVSGDVSRIKDGSDPTDDAVKKKLPTITYDARKFSIDGTMFIDLVRQPTSNACYQCHSQRTVGADGIDQRWMHDEDVHLRAGMDCVDCHRNGIDHDIVRGFEGQTHADVTAIETLSCTGCHLGTDGDAVVSSLSGRLGSPKPLHEGLPPVHFEKLSCTACHSGPVPREEAIRMMTSLAHGLGEKGHRTGSELPAMLANVFKPGADGRVHPHKAMWPAYWATMQEDGSLQPIDPESVYQWTRKSLRVRKDFVEEVKADEFAAKVSAALAAIEKETSSTSAVYVSSGKVYAIDRENEDSLRELDSFDPADVGMIAWPMAHNVRPAGWSLGVKGCTECHADDGLIFASTVTPIGPVDGDGEKITMASLQGVDHFERMAWNQMFSGRATFKYFIGGSIALLGGVLIVGLGLLGYRLQRNVNA